MRQTIIAVLALGLMACANTANDGEVLSPYDEDAGITDVGDAGPDDVADDVEEDGDAGYGGDADEDAGVDNGDDVNDINQQDGSCQPAADGILRRNRYPLVMEQEVPFRFSFDVDVDTAGEEVDGLRTWDLSEGDDDDITVQMALEDPQDHWFGDEFPDATYASRLSGDPDVDEYGLFQLTDDALLLLGVASASAGYYRTELTYDPPVTILSFPFQEGDSWQSETSASGSFGGNHFHSHDEDYTATVDAAGQVMTPYGTFPVLRVNTFMVRGYWGIFGWTTDEVRTYAFVAECFGTVARIISEEDEAEQHFDRAAEVMRLAQ